ncbi:peptidyl-prolyl cis-trans isomerase [Robertkochia solimangrovi]|uniref:peptidylprolyl isomerase n=1 Tax=Robertkochia solimangrovi TaxID=2213046 RepID=UPI00117ED2CC|nr:peptidylprolyl isomerase [Robertkochia solimangrovi]TRZ45083.1 hypothetical protein DMZ48_04845 [Robertkochia solimangrovi]
MKKFLKEPLLHFFVLGALFFLVYGMINRSENEEEIIVDNADIEHMIEIWEMQWQRPPSSEELQGMITKYVDQEVMYREALRLNLDHNDEIVKRRLAQKMEFLGNDLSAMVAPPTHENLRLYYDQHQEKYATEYVYTLHQIIFTADKNEDPIRKAQSVLKELQLGNIKDLVTAGDNFPLPYFIAEADEFKLNREFGEKFTEQLAALETGKWIGPVISGFGAHLVYIESRKDPVIPKFSQVEEQVKRDFEYEMVKESKSAILNELKKRYNIRIEADNIDQELKKEFATNQN